VPPFQWFVDDLQHPEDVSIIMKNIGLNDGADEGIGFTLSGTLLKDHAISNFMIYFKQQISRLLTECRRVFECCSKERCYDRKCGL
jgi:hypothetical protein